MPPDLSPDRLSGTLLDGRYRVQRKLATGGTASVYVGVDERLERPVALKIVHPHFSDDPRFVERAQREAKAAARLHHPNVVTVLDQGHTSEGVVYLVLEYVDGLTLRQVMAREAPMTPRRVLELLVPALRGLAQAHRHGLIHRDIKPENVLLTTAGEVKVADFGLTRAVGEHTSTGTVMGTVAYAAPELVSHAPVDQRCDVYAVGIMTYEMLTGSRPYTGTALQLANAHVSQDVPPPSGAAPGIDRTLDEFVLRSTRRDVNARPADAAALLELAMAVERSLPTLTDPVSSNQPTHVLTTEVPAPAASSVHDLDATEAVPAVTALPRMDADTTRTLSMAPAGSSAHSRDTAATTDRADTDGPMSLNPAVRPLHAAIGVVLFMLSLPLAAFLGWWLVSAPWATPVDVPDVTGQSVADAERVLSASGIDNVGVHTTTDPQVPEGSIISTDPGPSSQVRGLEQVILNVSEGPAQVDVPSVQGMSLPDARNRLTSAGFTVGSVYPQYSTEPQDTVLSQDPEAGTTISEGSAVNLTVATPDPPDEVPNVVGQPVDAARKTLEDLGFTVEIHEPVGSALGRVVHQREDGTTVILTVL